MIPAHGFLLLFYVLDIGSFTYPYGRYLERRLVVLVLFINGRIHKSRDFVVD